MRGDRPPHPIWYQLALQFTPHARGSTHIQAPGAHYFHVYPACAGIDPTSIVFSSRFKGLPRMRGDRPCHQSISIIFPQFTPHARGSTSVLDLR